MTDRRDESKRALAADERAARLKALADSYTYAGAAIKLRHAGWDITDAALARWARREKAVLRSQAPVGASPTALTLADSGAYVADRIRTLASEMGKDGEEGQRRLDSFLQPVAKAIVEMGLLGRFHECQVNQK